MSTPDAAGTRAHPAAPDDDAARRALLAAAFFGFTGVAAGAFGAHALRTRIDAEALALFDTAARYQLVHAVALLATAGVLVRWPGRAARAGALSFALGIVLFSGSLYALALGGARFLGALTPLGGLFLLVGWLTLALAARGAPRS